MSLLRERWIAGPCLVIEQEGTTVLVSITRKGRVWVQSNLWETWYGYMVQCPNTFTDEAQAHYYATLAHEFASSQHD